MMLGPVCKMEFIRCYGDVLKIYYSYFTVNDSTTSTCMIPCKSVLYFTPLQTNEKLIAAQID